MGTNIGAVCGTAVGGLGGCVTDVYATAASDSEDLNVTVMQFKGTIAGSLTGGVIGSVIGYSTEIKS